MLKIIGIWLGIVIAFGILWGMVCVALNDFANQHVLYCKQKQCPSPMVTRATWEGCECTPGEPK